MLNSPLLIQSSTMRRPFSLLNSPIPQLSFVLYFIVIVAFCTSCETKTPVKVQSVSISKTALSLVEGESERLSATVSPDNASDYIIAWSSSNSAVASVQDGLVMAEKEGSASITVSAGGKSASCSVTVSAKEIPVTSVSLSQTSVEMIVGEEMTLTATVEPDNATHKQLTWSSSDESVATVKEGLVSAVNAGTATISASAGGKTTSCTIKVISIPVTSVTLNESSLEMIEGDEFTLMATVKPDNATNVKLSWSSSDESVVLVDEGKLTAKGIGHAQVTVKAGDKSAACDVTVSKKIIHVESIKIDVTQKRLKVGETFAINTTVFPKEANDYEIVYSSSNSKVASVTPDGIIEGISIGKTTIHIEADGKTADCSIIVFEKDIIYAPTTKYVNYDYNEGTLWQNQDAILTAKYHLFIDVYLQNNQPFIVSSWYRWGYDPEYYQIYGNDFHKFEPGDDSNRNICQATAMKDNDIYSLVAWKYNDAEEFYGVWKNQELLFKLGDDAKISKYSSCFASGLFFDGDELYVYGSIMEPISETSVIEYPTIWKDGKIIKRFDVSDANSPWGGSIDDMTIVNGHRYYLVPSFDAKYGSHLALYEDNIKRFVFADNSSGKLFSHNGNLYAVIMEDSEGSITVYENDTLLYKLPVSGSATCDMIDGEFYFLVNEVFKWGGQNYQTVSVYRGTEKQYTLIEDALDPISIGQIKVYRGDNY